MWGAQAQMQPAAGAWSVAAGGGGWAGMQQQAAPAANNKDVTLVVTGCTHATVGGIVRGTFQLNGENHGKPTYKKDGQVNGLDVMSYYWDERDGPGFCGWWFGPKVGGDQVWAYHTDKNAPLPPQSGWKVPYDGPIDATLIVTQKPKGAAAMQQPAAQAWGQQAAAQNAWGQQQAAATNQNAMRLEQQRQQLAEMKQKQMAQQQQQLMQNKQKMEMANTQRIEEQKQKMELMKNQQAEMIRKRAEEQQKKAAELESKKIEQISVLGIRRAMQQFKATIPAKYEEHKKALDEAVAKELPKCGSQQERMTTEIEQAVAATNTRIQGALEAQKAVEAKKEEENKRRRELKEKAIALVEELEGMVVKAETAAKGATEEAEPLSAEGDMKMSSIESCFSAVEEAAKEAQELAKNCSEFATKENAAIRNVPPITGEPPSTCANDLAKILTRINEVKKTASSTLLKASALKMTKVKKANAKVKYEKTLVSFKKFDLDKDGKLSRREIQAFSKGEYSFSIPLETLDSICKNLVKDSSKGVAKEDFHRLKVMIGVAREAAIDTKRKADKEARTKKIADLKEKLQAKITKVAEVVTAATDAVAKAEKQVVPLTGGPAKALTAVEMVAKADETDAIIEESKTSLTKAKESVAALNSETEPELKGFLTSEVKKLEGVLRPVESRNIKATSTSTRYRTDASKKNDAELEKLRAQALEMIFYHQGAKKLLSQGVYQLFESKKSKGKVDESSFVKFFKICEKQEEVDMPEEEASRVFALLDEDDAGHLTKDKFLNFIRRFMKVVKASVLTEDIGLKSKPLRRLAEGEVMEIFSGPTKDEGADIARLKVKATSDDLEGWVTPVGNQGSVFLEDGGDMFKVVKETILTGSFIIGEDKETKDRKLKVGEILQVREWSKKEAISGLMRMKVKVKADGQVGWATQMGNTGITFLECL